MPQASTGRKSIPRVLRTYFQVASRVAPGKAGRQAYYLFCRPFAMQKANERERDVNARGSERVIRKGSDHVTVYCFTGDESASRRNVYMVHGWASCGSKLNAWVEPLLEAGFNVSTSSTCPHTASPRSSVSSWSPRSPTCSSYSAGGRAKWVSSPRPSRPCTTRESKELGESLPDTMFVETNKLGHRRIMRDPQVIARGIEFLLADDPASARVDKPLKPTTPNSDSN